MKRYWLFSNSEFYPSGGMEDFVSDHETIEECVMSFKNCAGTWYHIFDSEQHVVVDSNNLPDRLDLYKHELDIFTYPPINQHLCKIFPISLWDNE